MREFWQFVIHDPEMIMWRFLIFLAVPMALLEIVIEAMANRWKKK